MRVFAILVLLTAEGTIIAQDAGKGAGRRPAVPSPIKITIPAFPDGGSIPQKYARTDTGNLSPAIQWAGAPAGTVSFTLILHDNDVPSRSGEAAVIGAGPEDTLHWLIFNIPGSATGLPEGVPHETRLSDGSLQLKYVDGVPRLAIGTVGYFGPSPPPQQAGVPHHYIFDLYALDAKLDRALASRQEVMKAMAGHVLATGSGPAK